MVTGLLNASDADALDRLFWDGSLTDRLESVIPAGHELRAGLDRFIAERLGPGRRVVRNRRQVTVRTGVRTRAFDPGLISPSLAGACADLTPQQFDEALQAVGVRSGESVIRRLGLSGTERDAGRAWLDELRAATERRRQIADYQSGDPRHDLDPDARRRLIEEAAAGLARWQALDVLEESADQDLADLFPPAASCCHCLSR